MWTIPDFSDKTSQDYDDDKDRTGELLLVLHILLLVDNPEKVAVGLALLGTGRGETSLQTGQGPAQRSAHNNTTL